MQSANENCSNAAATAPLFVILNLALQQDILPRTVQSIFKPVHMRTPSVFSEMDNTEMAPTMIIHAQFALFFFHSNKDQCQHYSGKVHLQFRKKSLFKARKARLNKTI